MRQALLFAAALAASGCAEAEERPQWLVHIGTDATVPAFGDRVRVELIAADGSVCAECQRTFDAAELPISFGVEPGSDDPPRLRITLYRSAVTDSEGEPAPPLIELLASLPELSSEVVSLVAPLRMSCFGPRSNLALGEGCDPSSGERRSDLVLEAGEANELPATGSFDGEAPECAGEEPGMVCVPGGVFLMGSATYVPLGVEFDPSPEQLVRARSLWLDADEMTVSAMRELVKSHDLDAPVERGDDPYCTYTSTTSDTDDLPVNCLSRKLAKEACEAQGKRLPLEVEWELAASGGRLDAPYPWQLTDTTNAGLCAQAVLARGTNANAEARNGSRACVFLESDLPEGPQPVAETRDEGHFGLRNMGGNLAEWVADDHSPFADNECWGDSNELRESPSCVTGADDGVTKGGDYLFFTYNSHSFYRRAIRKTAELEFVGFRCAKDGQ